MATKNTTKTTKTTKTTNSTASTGFGDLISGALKDLKKPKAVKQNLSITLQGTGSVAVKLLAALKSIEQLVEKITKFGRNIVKENVMPEFAKHLANGGDVQSIRVNAGDAECLVVMQRRYAKIEDPSAMKALGLDVSETKTYSFSEAIAEAISKNPNILGQIENLIKTSDFVDQDVRDRVANGLIGVIEEKSSYEYVNDPMDAIGKLSGGDVQKALNILDATKPVFMIRSYKVNNSELEVKNALDMIKQSVDSNEVAA